MSRLKLFYHSSLGLLYHESWPTEPSEPKPPMLYSSKWDDYFHRLDECGSSALKVANEKELIHELYVRSIIFILHPDTWIELLEGTTIEKMHPSIEDSDVFVILPKLNIKIGTPLGAEEFATDGKDNRIIRFGRHKKEFSLPATCVFNLQQIALADDDMVKQPDAAERYRFIARHILELFEKVEPDNSAHSYECRYESPDQSYYHIYRDGKIWIGSIERTIALEIVRKLNNESSLRKENEQLTSMYAKQCELSWKNAILFEKEIEQLKKDKAELLDQIRAFKLKLSPEFLEMFKTDFPKIFDIPEAS